MSFFTHSEIFKTRVLTAVVVVSSVIGNVSLSRGMREVGATLSLSPLPYLHALWNPWVIFGVCVLTLWMLANLALLSRADLSFVLPVTAIAYVLIAIAGRFALGETISGTRWLGIAVITAGVIFVSETPPRTTPDPNPEHQHGEHL